LTLKKWTRVGLTILILSVIASQVELAVVGELTERANPLWLAAAFTIVLIERVLVARRFQVLLGVLGIDCTLLGMIRVVLMSNALGQLLPTGIGQDVIRGHEVVRSHGRAVDVSASIIQERLVGIGSMLGVALVAGLCWLEDPLRGWIVTGVLLVAATLACSYAAARAWSRRGGSLPSRLPLPERFRSALLDVARAVSDTGRVRPVFGRVLGISVTVQLTRCLEFWCLYAALGSSVALEYTLAFIPCVFLVTSIPLSLGGVGVREGVLIGLVGQLGVSVEVNVAAGLLYQVLVLVALLPGLALYAFRGTLPAAAQLPGE